MILEGAFKMRSEKQVINDTFVCPSCKRPKPLKQLSDKVFCDKPMCKKCAKTSYQFPSW
jgi:ribosomal protein L37AE/L43A